MLPTVAIIGRTNVGKSTIFNKLLKENRVVTHDTPGVTRDRVYGRVNLPTHTFDIVDTGGLDITSSGSEETEIFEQAREAIEEASLLLMVTDGKVGLTPLDQELAGFVRKSNKPVRLVVNKVDGPELEDRYLADFYSLGWEVSPVSAAHGYGVRDLIEDLCKDLPSKKELDLEASPRDGLKIAMLGRPNVGKSSIINSLIGDKRLITSENSGTTRDSVDVELEKDGAKYVFVDTPGVRRRTRISNSLERFSVLRSLKSSSRAHVTIHVVDAAEALTSQDKKLLDYLNKEKPPFILAVNKVDLVARKDRPKMKKFFEMEMKISSHVPIIYTSAVTKAGFGGLLPLAEKLWDECQKRVGTGELNRVLTEIIQAHQPQVIKGQRPKFYYFTQADTTPPTFVFFMNNHLLLKAEYVRFLEKQIRKMFGFKMAPIRLIFRTSQG